MVIAILSLALQPKQVKGDFEEETLVEEPILGVGELEPDPVEVDKLYKDWQKEQARLEKARQIVKRAIVSPWSNRFVRGNCTYYVASRIQIPWLGNANRWIANSKAYGAVVNKTPEVGAILATNESRLGHVAYIESVDGDTFTISEWNYAGLYKKTIRTFNINDSRIIGIIHYSK